jgi:competence protein ComEC
VSGPNMTSQREAQALQWFPAMPPLGIGVAVALLGGVTLACGLPRLPAEGLSWGLASAGLLMWIALARWRWLAAFVFGLAWACLQGGWAMQQRIPAALEGADLVVQGRVNGLPQAAERSLRFDFVAESGLEHAEVLAGKTLRLSWYGEAPELQPGSRWQLRLRLKRPRGVINPGGFDFERYALERRLAATGYVRESLDNREIGAGGGIDGLRQRLSDVIAKTVATPRARFVQALALGDTRMLTERDWEILRATGIAHLIAISGFHVGLVAGFGALLIRLMYRAWPRLGLRLALPQAAALAALVFAGGYTALAGFALPTVRTWLMLAAALLAVLSRRRFDAWQAVALSLIAVLLVDPLSVLGAGFWLSFLGVAWLLWCLPHERKLSLRNLLSAQGVMSLSLLPLTVWFFGQASIVGPLANLIAVPWVSGVVVPLALIGTALCMVFEPLGVPFFEASGWTMQLLWWGLEAASHWRGALAYLAQPDALTFGLALLGAFWLLLPRGVPGKPLAALLFLPLLWPARELPAHGEAEVWLLDVGQGLSVVVRTRDHVLLYDAGPAYAGGLDLGDAAVVPALRAMGVTKLHTYVESHGDNDHAGGSDAVLRAFAPDRLFASDPERATAQPCVTGEHWEWNGVHFRFLHPPPHFPYLKNDSSCVLRVEAAGASLLLPGDISETVEARLVREQRDALPAEVLIVPHHGSRTSSSAQFIAAVGPELALIGAGHHNRFDLPRPDVVQRYIDSGSAVLDSAASGAIRFELGPEHRSLPIAWREATPRFWREE